MATVLPFKAIRPRRDAAADVAALPYDAYSSEEARAYVKNKPLSFLNIDRPETQFSVDHHQYAADVYLKARDMLMKLRQDQVLIQDEKACYYIYEITMHDHVQTGIMALSAIDDYLNDVCKKHENTIPEKEQDRISHVSVTSMQTGPIFLAYRAQTVIDEIVRDCKRQSALYDFVADDGVRHRVWLIDDPETIRQLREAFDGVEATYIADGHHRAASAVKVALSRRAAHPDYDGTEEFNYFLSLLFPDHDLQILDYNRVVRDLNHLSREAFLDAVSAHFTIQPIAQKQHPSKKGDIAMYLHHHWYMLTVKPEILAARQAPVDSLDVAILQDLLLSPVLGIQDPRTDKRIQFVGGIRGLDELVRRVDCRNSGVAFAMYPTSISELFSVADASLLMPPKSTWFEPKPRSGLFIHEIER